MGQRRNDAGSTHVLEAVIIATIMVTAVAYVATFQGEQPTSASTRGALQQRATDALNILSDTPLPGSTMGDTELTAYIAECLQGNCTNMTTKLDQLLPAGTSYAISLSNGYDTFPVYSRHQPPGEAVTSSHLVEPKWSYTFLGTSEALTNPGTDSMVAYALPVFDSNLLDSGGSPLRILVHGTRQSDNSNFTVSASYMTQAVATADAMLYPATSLTFLDSSNASVGALNLSSVTANGSNPTGANVNMKVRLRESANVSLPAGTELRISMPRAWNASTSAALNPTWTIVTATATSAGDSTTSDLVARTTATIKNATSDFLFNVTYAGDLVQDYILHAALSKGALADANLIVRGESKTTDPYAIPTVVASVPRPMGANVNTTWTLGVAIPPSTMPGLVGSTKADTVTITQIEILEQDARNIFGNATLLGGPGGVASLGDRLLWNGSYASTLGPLSITFNVTPSGIGSPTVSRTAYSPPTGSGSWTGRLNQQAAAGFWRGSILPSGTYGGYNTTVATGSLISEHNLSGDGVYRALALPGSVNYSVANVSTVAGSIYGSYVGVERRNVPVGGTAVIDVDVQSLLFTLSAAGQKAGLRMNIYPPWAGAKKIPFQSNTSFDSTLLSSDVTAMTLLDVNRDGYADPILGTSNGRVLALHALTGARIQGDVFVAPISGGSTGTSAPAITQLSLLNLSGTNYVVAATDQGSIFVLNDTLSPIWYWYQGSVNSNVAVSILSLDSSADVDGDGLNDVVAGIQLKNAAGVSTGNLVYVLRALPGASSLTAWVPGSPGSNAPFYAPLGTPTAVLGLSAIGQNGTQGGIATTFQYVVGVAGMDDPTSLGFSVSLPRAGLRGVAANGVETWTFFGSPVTTARTFDYEGDGIPDIVGGSPAGYVFMMNGTTPTQPLYSTLIVPVSETVASSTHDAQRSAIITADGSLYFTDDAWSTTLCAGCSPSTKSPYIFWPTAKAIAMNASSSIWIGGTSGMMWRSLPATTVSQSQALTMSLVAVNATKGGVAFNPAAAGSLYDFSGLAFGWGATRDRGVAIGTDAACLPLVAPCAESLVMTTSNGGANWTVANAAASSLLDKSGLIVRQPLRHLNFTNANLGWIAGNNGTLLKTTDAGATWRGVNVSGTNVNLTGAACAPEATSTCLAVGEQGSAWRSVDGGTTWTSIDLSAQVGTRTLLSVGMASAKIAYIGSTNMVLKTWDGGNHWSQLPMNYIQANGDMVDVLPDGSGYIYGGTPAHQRTFILSDYGLASRAQTTNLAGALPAGASVNTIDLEANISSKTTNVTLAFSVSANGGTTWFPLSANTTMWTDIGPLAPDDPRLSAHTNSSVPMYPKDETHVEDGSAVYDNVNGYTYDFRSSVGNDIRLRVDFNNTGDFTEFTSSVHGGYVNLTYTLAGIKTMTRIPLDVTSTAQMDASATTAAWDTNARAIHQKLVGEYWTRNVSGAVTDIQVGGNITGDSRGDIYISTGAVIAENSPDSVIYAGANANSTRYPDNRIYLLDGANGTIAANTSAFWGTVTHLAISDINHDGVPEYLYATVWDQLHATLVCLDPVTLAIRWTDNVTTTEPSALAAGAISGPNATAIISDRTATTGPTLVAGKTLAYVGYDDRMAWGTVPDVEGRYTINLPVPRSWLFGPYVVEVGVEWNATATEAGVPTPKDVVQTAHFYDAFLVTPPSALSPPSPIYNVQLTTWYDDWR